MLPSVSHRVSVSHRTDGSVRVTVSAYDPQARRFVGWSKRFLSHADAQVFAFARGVDIGAGPLR